MSYSIMQYGEQLRHERILLGKKCWAYFRPAMKSWKFGKSRTFTRLVQVLSRVLLIGWTGFIVPGIGFWIILR